MQAVCSSRNAALLQLTLRIVRKLLWMLLVLWGITLISFWVIHLAPGSPTDMETTLNPLAGEAARQRLEALYGLDKPLHVQYLDWLSRLVRLDFGLSMSADGRPVLDKIMERLPLTVGMNVISLILTLVIAIPIGILSACRQNSLLDRGVTVFVYLGFAMPSFWLALLLMLFFGIHLQWLPISGLTSMNFDSLGPVDKVLDLARHLALPILVYTIGSLAGMSRYMRACMLEVLRQDYILTAQAKGLSPRTIIWRHALRNALLPVITLLGLSVPGLIGGSVIIESIFALPGLGQLFYAAVMARDYTMIMGNLVLGAVLTLLGNLLADVWPIRASAAAGRFADMCGPLLRRFLGRHLMLCLGLGIVLVMSLAALCAPLLAPYDPNALHLDHILEPPSSMFWLGTDRLGRDVFSRLLYGGQISLWVGFVAVGISVSIGTGLGLISGYFGGLVDEGIMRGVDIMLCFPSFFLILSVIAFLEPSLTNIMIVIGLTSWMGVARLVRAETLSLRQRDFVSAARLSGCSTCRILLRHILPNTLAPVLISATLGVAGAILVESGLSFLGLGVQPPTASWGNMLMEGKTVLEDAPWLSFYPGVAILVTVLGYNLLGESLRDLLDPRLKK